MLAAHDRHAAAPAPPLHLPCDGRRLRRDDYPELAAAIAGAYGEADGETFVLPDCRPCAGAPRRPLPVIVTRTACDLRAGAILPPGG